MRIVITGGAGFIGSHLAEQFLAEGHQVVALDNLVTGDIGNVAHLREDPEFEFIYHDVTYPIYVSGPVDWVLHFASPASPPDYLAMPIETLKVGSYATHNALGLARAKNARFFLASTSEVYGDPLVHPQPEAYWGHVNSIGPRSVYDEAKRYAEAVTMAYHRQYDLDTRIVRIFNTYGPRMRANDGRVVSTFINQALVGEALTVFGDGTQTRSFQHITDLVRGIRLLMDADVHEPVNIGNPEEFTIRDFADLVLRLTGSQAGVEFRPLPQDDPKQRRPDITRAQDLLGWKPEIRVEDGVGQLIYWYQERLELVPRPTRVTAR